MSRRRRKELQSRSPRGEPVVSPALTVLSPAVALERLMSSWTGSPSRSVLDELLDEQLWWCIQLVLKVCQCLKTGLGLDTCMQPQPTLHPSKVMDQDGL